MRVNKIIVSAISILCVVPGLSQVRTTLGPLVITVPPQYNASIQRKGSQLTFVVPSPKMTVIISTFKAPVSDNAWAALDQLAEARHKGEADVKRTQWLGLPAVLYRIDQKKGSTVQYRLVLTALDTGVGEAFQLEILFTSEVVSDVQQALERWTRAVKYERSYEFPAARTAQ